MQVASTCRLHVRQILRARTRARARREGSVTSRIYRTPRRRYTCSSRSRWEEVVKLIDVSRARGCVWRQIIKDSRALRSNSSAVIQYLQKLNKQHARRCANESLVRLREVIRSQYISPASSLQQVRHVETVLCTISPLCFKNKLMVSASARYLTRLQRQKVLVLIENKVNVTAIIYSNNRIDRGESDQKKTWGSCRYFFFFFKWTVLSWSNWYKWTLLHMINMRHIIR